MTDVADLGTVIGHRPPGQSAMADQVATLASSPTMSPR